MNVILNKWKRYQSLINAINTDSQKKAFSLHKLATNLY